MYHKNTDVVRRGSVLSGINMNEAEINLNSRWKA